MSFKEIIGQENAIKILQNSLQERRLGISYLFYGPEGVGKSFTAKEFAKSLNCQEGTSDTSAEFTMSEAEGLSDNVERSPAARPCGQCPACLKSDKLEYPDLHWLDIQEDSQNIGIEQIRQMQSALNLRPFEAKVKVFVVNNAQALSEEAANCLLKVIEEPPADSVIILITSGLRAVLPTISSRCQKIKFSHLSRAQVEEILREEHNLDPQESSYLARYCEGKAGQAKLLGRGDFLIKRKGILDAVFHPDLSAPQAAQRIRKAEAYGRAFEEFFKDKAQAVQGLAILMSYFRDVMFVKAGLPAEYLINQDRLQEVMRVSGMCARPELLSLLAKLSKSFEYIEQNINLRLLTDDIWTDVRRIWKK